MLIALALLPLALVDEPAAHRQLVSVGCDNCCFKNDCSLAYSQTSPGVCCGAHPYSTRRQTGCCPMGSTCVACGHIWKCSRATYVTKSGRCSMCRDDQVRECLYRPHYGGYHHGGSNIFGMLLLLLSLCALASCFFYGNREPDAVIVQAQPYGNQMYGQQMGPGGQTIVMQGGGYGGGYGPGAGMATGAACGFVGGMMVGEALDHGHYGGGYGGEYGGGYGGGYGGDMGGGDMGFGADQ